MKNFILLGLVIVAVTLSKMQGATAAITAASTAKAQAMESLLNATQAAGSTAKQCIQDLTQDKMAIITQAKICVSNYTSLLATLKADMLAAGMNFESSAMSSAIDKINNLSDSMKGALGSMSNLISSMKTSLGNAKSTILNKITNGLTSSSWGFVTDMTSALNGAMAYGMNMIVSIPFFG